jgi:hypothetical protein
MADQQKQKPPAIDVNSANNILAQFGINPGSINGSGNTIEDVLQNTLLGTNVRQGLGGSPLVGIMPRWFKANEQLASAMRDKTFDPYMPMPDISSWQVYTPRPHVKITGATNATAAESAMSNLDTKAGDATQTVAAVSNQPYLWTSDQVAEAIKRFQDAGYSNVKDFGSMLNAWGGLVQQAGAMYSLSSGQRKVTPWDVLELNKSSAQKAGTLTGTAAGPSTQTETRRSVSNITSGDGWSALQNTLSRMLGRDPSDEEVRDFVGRMNHLAAANPTISTATRHDDGAGHATVTEHTKAGFNGNDVLQHAYQRAQADPNYAEYQSASTYYNAALSALGAIGG